MVAAIYARKSNVTGLVVGFPVGGICIVLGHWYESRCTPCTSRARCSSGSTSWRPHDAELMWVGIEARMTR
jgi:hypothetical protein